MSNKIPFEGPYTKYVKPVSDNLEHIFIFKEAKRKYLLIYGKAIIGEAPTKAGAKKQAAQYDIDMLAENYDKYFVEEGLPWHVQQAIKEKHMVKRGEMRKEDTYKHRSK
jgi:hypothetical protein